MDWRRRSCTYPAAFVAVLVAAVATGGLAVAEKPVVVTAGNPIAYFNAEVSPATLPKTKPAPIRLAVSTTFKAPGATTHPPAAKELLFKVDKHVGIDVRKIPAAGELTGCPGLGRPRSIGALRKACAEAVIGGGRMQVEVQFPDQPPISVESKLLVLNGGIEGGVTKAYLYTYFTAPVTSWVVTTVKIKKVRERRYGMEVAASVPKIAGGAGSVTFFTLWLKRGVFSATCPDGRLDFHNRSVFADGTQLTQPVIRTCTARETAR